MTDRWMFGWWLAKTASGQGRVPPTCLQEPPFEKGEHGYQGPNEKDMDRNYKAKNFAAT
jgi:hypothetical protein